MGQNPPQVGHGLCGGNRCSAEHENGSWVPGTGVFRQLKVSSRIVLAQEWKYLKYLPIDQIWKFMLQILHTDPEVCFKPRIA